MGQSTGEHRPGYMQKYKTQYAKKKRQVNVTLDAATYDKLEAEAAPQGMKVSALAREYILEGLGQHKQGASIHIPAINQETATELTRLMRNVANNFNQMAHHANLNAHLYGQEPTINVETAITSMWKQLQELEHKLKSTLLEGR